MIPESLTGMLASHPRLNRKLRMCSRCATSSASRDGLIDSTAGRYSLGEPRYQYLTGLRKLGSGECHVPYGFRSKAPDGYALCRPSITNRAGEVTFADPQGRQRYFIDAGGYLSQPTSADGSTSPRATAQPHTLDRAGVASGGMPATYGTLLRPHRSAGVFL